MRALRRRGVGPSSRFPRSGRPQRQIVGPRLRLVAAGGTALKDLTIRWGSKLLSRLSPYVHKNVMDGPHTILSMHEPLLQQSIPASTRALDGWRVTAGNGRFEVRLTRDSTDIASAQALRYQVFYEEMYAEPTPEMAASRRDCDHFDHVCDHLIVLDHKRPAGHAVVGTYRLLRQDVARRHGGFYSSGEYDLSLLLDHVGSDGGLLELGRSCVHADYRTNATIQLLWRGIATYMNDHGITHMFGCASLAGTDPDALALPLSYLHHHHRAPAQLRVRALEHRYVQMNRMCPEAISARHAIQSLPPLIKAYLRLGAYIGDGAVIDHQFGTTDVFILLPVERIAEKYFSHFERDDALHLRA